MHYLYPSRITFFNNDNDASIGPKGREFKVDTFIFEYHFESKIDNLAEL